MLIAACDNFKMHPGSPRRQSVGVPLPTQFGSEHEVEDVPVTEATLQQLFRAERCLPVPGF